MAAAVAIALLSGILCMGSVSFLAPRGRSRSLQPEGYAAFFMPPVHNLRVYLCALFTSNLGIGVAPSRIKPRENWRMALCTRNTVRVPHSCLPPGPNNHSRLLH